MANKFLKTLASAFVVENEGGETEGVQSNNEGIQSAVAVPQQVSSATVSQPQSSVTATASTQPATPQLNTQLLDKLCERLEAENLPGPDYMELKTAVMDADMVKIIPDERQRILASYRSLKVNSKDLTKQRILDSIDHYVSILNNWQEDAIKGLDNERSKVSDKKKQIEALREQMAQIQSHIDELNKDVLATESKCNQNEADMKTSVGFLVNKLTEDKNKISTILTD
mgnify:CR=1 FL=1